MALPIVIAVLVSETTSNTASAAIMVPNAIVYSSGLLPIMRMLKAGLVFDIIGAVLCVVGVTVMANLVGIA